MVGIEWTEIEQLSEGMGSSSEVDSFGCFVSGPAWAAERISDSKIKDWAKSPNRWLRRAALVSTLGLTPGLLLEIQPGQIVREVTRKLETGRKDGRKSFTVESAKESRGKS